MEKITIPLVSYKGYTITEDTIGNGETIEFFDKYFINTSTYRALEETDSLPVEKTLDFRIAVFKNHVVTIDRKYSNINQTWVVILLLTGNTEYTFPMKSKTAANALFEKLLDWKCS